MVEEPIPEDLQVNAINHLLGTVQELREALGELHGVFSIRTKHVCTDEQRREFVAQRELVAKQVEDTTKLHVGSFVQKTHQRDVEKKARMAKFPNANIKR